MSRPSRCARAQASAELLTVFSLLVFVLLVCAGIYQYESKTVAAAQRAGVGRNAALRLASAINGVYASGSNTSYTFYLPEDANVTVSGRYAVARWDSGAISAPLMTDKVAMNSSSAGTGYVRVNNTHGTITIEVW